MPLERAKMLIFSVNWYGSCSRPLPDFDHHPTHSRSALHRNTPHGCAKSVMGVFRGPDVESERYPPECLKRSSGFEGLGYGCRRSKPSAATMMKA